MEVQYREQGYLALIEGTHVAVSHAGMKCLGSCSFNTGVFEVKPTESELAELGCTVPELCDLAVCIGWMSPAGQDAVVQKFARVVDFKDALRTVGVKPKGLKADLLQQVTRHCPEWLTDFTSRRPSFGMTDKGVIELQAHRNRVRPPIDYSKGGHRAQMLKYLALHVADAMQADSVVLGFSVTIRDDWPHCEFSDRFAGVFLPDEMPDLYPVDCPDESACACILYNSVLCGDASEAAAFLERRHIARFGRSPCREPWIDSSDRGRVEAPPGVLVVGATAAPPIHKATGSMITRMLAWIKNES